MDWLSRDIAIHEAEQDQDELRQQAIDARTDALTAEGAVYDPCEYFNCKQAIDEANYSAMKAALSLMRERKYEEFGRAIAGLSEQHWRNEAYTDAKYEVDNPDDFDEPDDDPIYR